ncbi:MAG: GNAT family N-acetyltransferase, partial [Bifidobacteriaceae bacterium]|nr:GNAT family N-acetyltransferase [Bifidobacteriaceae bacterium]
MSDQRRPRSIAERARAPHHAEVPSPHLQLEWRRLVPTDLDQLTSLIKEAEEADGALIDSVTDVIVDLVVRDERIGVDTLGGFDRVGIMRAYGAVHLWPEGDVANVVFYGAVDPSWGGRGIGRALLAWQEGRARQMLSRVSGSGPARLSAYVEDVAADRRRLYVAAGFSQEMAYLRVRRDLAAPIPEPDFPEGIVVRHASEVSEASVLECHGRASGEAWGEGPPTALAWHRRWGEYKPEWSFVAIDPAQGKDHVIGYVLARVQLQAWSKGKRTEASIHRLGVDPAYRRRGIGRALVTRALKAFAESG